MVFGEEPYAEGHGDRENLEYQRGDKTDLALLKKLKGQGIKVVSVFISGRPMWINAELNASDAFVAAWLPGSEGLAVADVIMANADGTVQTDFKGKLSFSWPNSPDQATVNRGDSDYTPLLPYGFGLGYGDENVLNNELNETFVRDTTEAKTRKLFDGKVHKPWLMQLISGDQIDISASSHSIGALSYRTIDKVVQEDAIKLVADGSGDAQMRLVSKSHFREDLMSALENKAALQFEVKLDQAPSSAVTIGMNCEGTGDPEGSCRTEIDITKQLNALPQNQWNDISIDLNCFVKQGIRLTDIVVPFSVSTSGKLTMSLTNIVLEPNKAANATLSCQ